MNMNATSVTTAYIQKGGSWATAPTVSAALREVGVSVSNSVVCALANQDYGYQEEEERPLQCAKKNLPNNATPAAAADEDLRLVYWPSILDFLEEDPSDALRKDDPNSTPTSVRGVSPRRANEGTGRIRDTPNTSTATRDVPSVGAGEISSIGLRAVPGKSAEIGGACRGCQDGGGDALLDGGGAEIDREGGGDTFCGGRGAEIGQRQRRRQLNCARESLVEDGIDRANSGDVRGDPMDGVEDLVNAACGAAKKGDASAIKDLFDSADLRRSDAFGRNALYYACLCGHAYVAHLVVVRAYGGVEEIPENERWECRKNALSEEIRRYLDTGKFSESSRPESRERRRAAQSPAVGGSGCGTTSNVTGRSSRGFTEGQEGGNCSERVAGEGAASGVRHIPPAPAVEGRECGITANVSGNSRGLMENQEGVSDREGVGSEGSASGVRHTPPGDEVLSAAWLFDPGRGQEENGDY